MAKQKKQPIVHLDIEDMTKETSPKKEALALLNLGEQLERARKKKKVEIEDVAESLRIKAIYLEALEKGHYYAFPARSYAIGFLRNYARYLKLNPDDMVELYRQETNNDKDEPLDMLVLEKHYSLPSFKMVSIVLGAVFCIYLLWYLIAVCFYPNFFTKKEPELLQQASQVLEEEKLPETKTEEALPVIATEVVETKEVAKEAYDAPVAFIASDRVWVRILDTDNDKVLLDKTFDKNDYYIPKISLSDMAITTGRAGALDIYVFGKKFKTFAKENETSLDDLEDEIEDLD